MSPECSLSYIKGIKQVLMVLSRQSQSKPAPQIYSMPTGIDTFVTHPVSMTQDLCRNRPPGAAKWSLGLIMMILVITINPGCLKSV